MSYNALTAQNQLDQNVNSAKYEKPRCRKKLLFTVHLRKVPSCRMTAISPGLPQPTVCQGWNRHYCFSSTPKKVTGFTKGHDALNSMYFKDFHLTQHGKKNTLPEAVRSWSQEEKGDSNPSLLLPRGHAWWAEGQAKCPHLSKFFPSLSLSFPQGCVGPTGINLPQSCQ